MKTLMTIALTTMMAIPAFAAETNNVKNVTDVYVQQHSIDVETSVQATIKKDILNAINSFRVPLLTSSVDMLAQAIQDSNEVSEQADIE